MWYTLDVSNSKSAFTIIEIIVVVVIVGVLAAIAMPSYRIQMLKVKNQEAVRVLTALWEAQKDYYRDWGVYAPSTIPLSVDIPNLKNFNDPSVYVEDYAWCIGGPKRKLADVLVDTGNYTLSVLEDGSIVCTPCGGSICYKMGFEDDW